MLLWTFKFNGEKFEYIESTGKSLYGPSWSNLCTGFDGKVYTIFGSDTVNDLKIYENGRLTTQTIHSPHYSIKNLSLI